LTGGLGPTPDDLTTEAIADFLMCPWWKIQSLGRYPTQVCFAMGREINENNRKQALLPQGAEILPNPIGSAPGMIWQTYARIINFNFSWCTRRDADHVATDGNRFAAIAGLSSGTFFSRVLLYWGISESKLAERVQHLFASQNPTLAPYANYGQARLRITACAADQAAAEQLIAPFQAEILSLTGKYCYGSDNDTLASVVGQHYTSINKPLLWLNPVLVDG
jgi:nicotinamide-nucleotide amidase